MSADELAIGFPMGTSGLPVPETIGAIALQAFSVTFIGIFIGNRLSETLGHQTSRMAGRTAATAFAVLGMYPIAQRFLPGLPEL